MKRIVSALLSFVVLFSLVACDPGVYTFDCEELKREVVRIELINCNNPDAKELYESRDKVLPFDFQKMEILETLSEEKNGSFLEQFSELELLLYWRHLDSPQGQGFRLIYRNGDFLVVSFAVSFSCIFNEDGTVDTFIGSGMSIERATKIVNSNFEQQM